MRTFQSFHAAAVDGYPSHLRREQRKHFVRFADIDLAEYNAFYGGYHTKASVRNPRA